jgi:hypothetical protein
MKIRNRNSFDLIKIRNDLSKLMLMNFYSNPSHFDQIFHIDSNVSAHRVINQKRLLITEKNAFFVSARPLKTKFIKKYIKKYIKKLLKLALFIKIN